MSCSLSTQYLKSSKRALLLLEQPWLTTSHLKQIQSHLTVTGSISDPFAAGRLIAAHTTTIANPSSPAYAHRIFLLLPRRTPYIWNAMIRAFTESTQPSKSLSLYKDMIGSGFLPNNYTFSFVIRAAVDVSDITLGSALHGQAIRLGWESYDFVKNGLIHLYVACKCGRDCDCDCDCDSVGIVSARKLFDESCSSRDVVTWTALINGYVKSGQIDAARELFDRMPVRNAVSWGAMITGCAQGEFFEEALELFNEMQVSGVRPTHAAIVGALTACAFLGALDQGRWIHGYVLRSRRRNGTDTGTDFELDTKLGTALVDMYAKCGCIEVAEQVFEEIPCKDVYAFTSMISGLSNNGQIARSIEVFERMLHKENNPVVEPNSVTFLCALSACGRIGWVEKGLSIFKRIRSPGREHYGCVVDLLGRAGFVREAEDMVRQMPMEPDCYVLGALLNACRLHGDVEVGKETVRRLMEQKIKHGSGFQTLLSNIYASAKQWERVEHVRSGMGEKMPGCSSRI